MAKTVFITGGSRGIGAECVRLFSENGYKVAFSYLNSEKEAKALCEKYGAIAYKADVADSCAITSAINEATKELGKIDVLINNAGVSQSCLFTDITDEMWKRMLDTNLSGAFYATRAVLPQMINRKCGVILNVSSMWGEVGASCEVHYSASKAGLIGMTKALAKELGPSGITVNAIAPGLIETDMNKGLSEEEVKAVVDETPLMRVGYPREVAEAALFLASESAAFITGEVMNVSGGYIM